MDEHTFVPVPYPVFRAAIDGGHLDRVLALAREVGRISLADALRILLLVRDQQADRYEAAAVRWLGRFALEAHDVEISTMASAADAVELLRTDAANGMARLQQLCLSHGAG